MAGADGVRGLRTVGDLRHEQSANARRHLWRGMPVLPQGRRSSRPRGSSGTTLPDVR